MSDRWDDDEDLGERLRRRAGETRDRDRGREPEPEREPTVGELIEGSVRKLFAGIVIAGGLIGLGLYASRGGDPSVDYQIATTPDGHVYRLNSENGRIVSCQGQHCWLLPTDRSDLEDGPPAAAQPQQQQQPQVGPAQQPQTQLPAPQNATAPATR